MNIQSLLDYAVQAQRTEQMKTSAQLTLGELIMQLEALPDQSTPALFDDARFHPVGLLSWRGSYCELALSYEQAGEPRSCTALLKVLKDAVGATFCGYKGGEFCMSEATPVWVANYGEDVGFLGETQAVVGVVQREQAAMIETALLAYRRRNVLT